MQFILHQIKKLLLIQISNPGQTSTSNDASMNMTPRTPFSDLKNGLYLYVVSFSYAMYFN